MASRRSLDAHLPLKPVDFHVLLVLTDGDLHGYGIVKEIEERTGGGIRLEPGNLYRYVRRLVDEGMVEPAERREVHDRGDRGAPVADSRSGSSERRRYYRVTRYGREVLAAETMRMRALVAAVEARLAPPGS